MARIEEYASIVGQSTIDDLRLLGDKLRGKVIQHINSTSVGGGVAEILNRMVPLLRELGVDTRWDLIKGGEQFFAVTKKFHNALHGRREEIAERDFEIFRETSAENVRDVNVHGDIVFIHDPQPIALIERKTGNKWIWRCHVDVSDPNREVWEFLRDYVVRYDSAVFSSPSFSQRLPLRQFLIAPSIDPLSDKNITLDPAELEKERARFGLDPHRPLLVQISRFDRFKDPVGVIQAYQLVRKVLPVQLVLAGGEATDDPEGKEILEEVMGAAGDDPDIHVLLLPPDSHRTINALQRMADIIIQKSTREGFGLTVTEGLWKGKPVIGGDVGGIKLQIANHYTGYLVNTPEGAAHRIRFLLHHQEQMQAMGKKAREFVRENFLLTRQLREYLTLFAWLLRGEGKHTIMV